VIRPIVKSAICDEDVCGGSLLLDSTLLVLLGANHDEGKLSCRLPNFILLGNLLCIRRCITSSLIITRFRLLSIVNFITIIMRTTIHRFVFFLSLYDGPFGKDIEAGLSFCDQLAVLVLLKADILFLYLLLGGLVALVD
jgi:hypothetical protein